MLQLRFLTRMMDKLRENPYFQKLEGDPRIMIFIAVLCIASICAMTSFFHTEDSSSLYRMIWICVIAIALIVLYCSGVYAVGLRSSRSLLTIIAVNLQLVSIPIVFMLQSYVPLELPKNFALLFIPWMFAPALTSILVGRRMGMFTSLCVALIGVALCPSTDYHTQSIYLATSMLSGVTAALLCGRVHKREHILYAGFMVGLVVFASNFVLGHLYQELFNPSLSSINWRSLGLEFVAAVGMSFMYAVYIGGLTPFLERIFNISTPITWLELGDMNHKLLKELQLRAPGTFHHSIVVSRLAEAAAEEIGVNATHCAVCALFHDIGKLKDPHYFAENINESLENPHDKLTPDMSAKIICGHVEHGLELATEHRLNPRIIDSLREHHGTSTAYFFYRKALDFYEAEMQRFEKGLIDTQPKPVDIKAFSYQGPRPQSKESGIVSMADAVESATRSLKNPTESDIRDMIESIFKGRILDGHLNDSKLTLGDLELMKSSFFTSIKSMHHNRIAYPKPKEDEEAQETKEAN